MEDTQLAQTVLELIRSGNEGLTHELKWDVDVTNKEDQAEFIRDVMSLANADPHNSNDRYLVMNAGKGEVNAEAASCTTDGAVFQDIVNERVSPRIKFSKHDSVPTELGEVTILVIENTYEFPYVARKDVGQIKKPLRKGECWTRSGSQKRLATAEDYREMEGARAERGIGPSGVPNADAIVASEPSEVGTLAEKALEAEKRSVLTRAIKRVAAETVQAWRSTENNKDEDYLEEIARKLTVRCDWLTVVARTAIEFEDQAALAECMSGLKAIYRLSAEEGLGHAGVAPVELSAWCPMLTAFPRVYIVGAFAIVHGCMRSVEIVCNVQVLRPSRVAPRPKLLVNDPLFDLLSGALLDHSVRFRSAIELAESNPLFDCALAGSTGPVSALCQFDLMASVLTPDAEWGARSMPAHFPSFLLYGFDMVQPLIEKAVETPELLAMIGCEPVHAILSHLKMLEEKVGSPNRRQLGPWSNKHLFELWYERIEPYLRVERERREEC